MRRGFWDRVLLAAATISALMRGRRRWAGAVALAAIAGIAALLVPGRTPGIAAVAGPRPILAATGPTPYDLYDSRSPGIRPAGALFQTKPPRQRVLSGLPRSRTPSERVLPTIREHPGLPYVPDPAATVPPLASRTFVPPPAGLVPNFPTLPSVPTLGPTQLANNPTTPIGPSNPTPPGTPVQPPAGAVPEPSTWAMMTGGIGLLGAALRRARRRPVRPGRA